MKLIDDWKKQFPRLWSVRMSLASALATGAETGMNLYANNTPRPLVIAACIVSIAAAIFRIIAQPKVTGNGLE